MLKAMAFLAALLIIPLDEEDYPKDLRKWYVTELSKVTSEQWLVAQSDFGRDGHDWVVRPDGANPRVELADQNAEPVPLPFKVERDENDWTLTGWHIQEKVDDGWLVAFDRGEFGGNLWWFSTDGKTRYKISDEIVTKFFPYEKGFLALEGIPHGVGAEGKIARIFKDKDLRWKREEFVDIGSVPYTAMRETDGSLLIATKHLLRIEIPSKKRTILLEDAFWNGLYPNSMVISDQGDLFIGMRHGVFQWSRTEMQNHGSGKWLLPSESVAKQKFKPGFK